jgi:hypothetical protein
MCVVISNNRFRMTRFRRSLQGMRHEIMDMIWSQISIPISGKNLRLHAQRRPDGFM